MWRRPRPGRDCKTFGITPYPDQLTERLINNNRPNTLRPAYDIGDRVHPNNAGYHRMAQTIPLTQL